MKTKLFYYVLIGLITTYFWSCDKLDSNYKQFIGDGEITYVEGADSLKIKGGNQRAEVSWMILSDPRVFKYKIYWDNRQDSLMGSFERTKGIDTVKVIVDNLEEGTHDFQVVTFDENDNSSVVREAIGTVYGDFYKKSLLNRAIKRLSKVPGIENALEIHWEDPDSEFLFSELKYKDLNGDAKLHISYPEKEKDTLRNIFYRDIKLRSAYIPDSTAIDTFYTEYEEIKPESNLFKTQPQDMILTYIGGEQRPDGWFQGKHFKPYIALERDDGTFDWLFDGFLFLEIKDGEKSFFGSHGTVPTKKEDWRNYTNKFFAPGYNIPALNQELEAYKLKGGASSPFRKRKIIIGIPEAKEGQKNWGSLDGRELDFDREEDRITAYKWFIDYTIEKFNNHSYDNLELVAFYWIQEGKRVENTINNISNYLHEKSYYLYWIPHMLGADNINNRWESLGFDRSYLQPGYFYRTDNDYPRLAKSAEMVNKYEYSPYVEFDSRALKRDKNWGYRLNNTIDVFEEYEFWDSSLPIGYYQSFNTWYQLYHSKDKEDVKLYYRLANIIAGRQRELNKK